MLIPFEGLVKKYNIKPKGVLHCGANSGQERFEYDRLGFKEVIWVEALPSVYQELRQNLEPYPLQLALNACVSDTEEKVVFNISNNEAQSSSFFQFGVHSQIHPTVQFVETIELTTIRLDKLLSKFDMRGIDFLNFDLQGAEYKALLGMGAMLSYFNYAYLELNFKETYIGCTLVEELDEFMKGYGFERVETSEIIGGSWADGFYVHKSKL